MGVTDGNPIIVTSGTSGTLVTSDNRKVRFIFWEQPDLTSTSSLVIRKCNYSGQIYSHMRCEVSGQSQTLKYDMWWNAMFIELVPTGTLYIYQH